MKIDLNSPTFLADLNAHLAYQSYLHGFNPTVEDVIVVSHVGREPKSSEYPHVARHFRTINSLSAQEQKNLPQPESSILKHVDLNVACADELCDGKFEKPNAKPVTIPETMKKKEAGKSVASGFPAPKFEEFSAHRIALWEKLKANQPTIPNKGEKLKFEGENGKTYSGEAGVTRPIDLAKEWLQKDKIGDIVVVKIDGKLWDLGRVTEFGGKVEFLEFDHPEAQEVFWHSSSHILGQALERVFGGNLTKGPPTESGFFYDIYLGSQVVNEESYEKINSEISKILKEKQVFERILVTKQDGLELFKHNPFKLEIIRNKVPDDALMSIYRCGTLIDPCRGPHIPNTQIVKSCVVTKNSGAYWEGKAGLDSLQRVYGISFPSKERMTEWQHIQEEAKKRDHRLIGLHQELFFFQDLSPGSCFWLPHGTRIYNKLIETIKKEYWNRGFQEVVTPNMYSMKLWEISGHATKYRENMFLFDVEGSEFALKPMNCPGHCLMFAHRHRSYRELPIRFADFGVLHRNEISGALHGLTRVRRFQQDDAHIFCMPAQIKEEITGCLNFLNSIYGIFGFHYDVRLSTRPEQYLGEIEVWNAAEKALADALDESGLKWEVNPGDGAFYGPKIDITLTDALKRKIQCGTIQLDFQLPERFGLEYTSSEADEATNQKFARPVIIHRAILGSVERFVSIVTEQYAGKWPFWLSPRQGIVVPVAAAFNGFAEKVKNILQRHGYYVDVELSSKKFAKKVRESQLSQYNFILVVGEEEEKNESVNVRTRDNVVHGMKTIDELLQDFRSYSESKSNSH
eukprot:c18140_g1_i2.p1 GENE.c18140_g1_i2~~c18140_g1_i2.p1  ORF type:complete len:799 (-),score=310.51 c18140_g1_i2:158-2554(-)